MDQLDFYFSVYDVVRQIPKGKVATYGQIAALLGFPGRARMVGHALAYAPDDPNLPCHRVVNASGRLAPNFVRQRSLLQAEAVTFRPNGAVDLTRHLWDGSI